MTASWLAQMGWEVYVLAAQPASARSVQGCGAGQARDARGPDRYRRPYEGTDAPPRAMQAYLDWEFGLVAQLELPTVRTALKSFSQSR